jgi:hypothetical protein
MGWTAPPEELTNYTCYDNRDDARQAGSDLAYNPWYSEETQAWVCNQRDDCKGFVVHKDRGSGGWFKKTNAEDVPSRVNSVRKTCVKKSYSYRKADNPDTGVEGVLPKDETQSRVKGAGWSDWAGLGDYNIGLGTVCCGQPGYPQCNNMNAYKIPLGWKWMFTDSGIINGNAVEGYWDRAGMGWDGQTYTLDRPNNHGMTDRDDCALVQNIGFDVAANFTSMVSKGVHPTDALKIRHNWCNKQENIDNANCTNFYSTPEAAAAGFRYDQDLFYICKTSPTWFQKTSCRTAFNNAVKGTNESLRQQAKDAISTYCNTPDGENQADGLCGCANVMKYGGRCLTDKGAIPGCRELKATVGDLPPGAQIAFADKFCASDVCVTQALGNAALLPDYTAGKQCPNITQCVQDFRNANFQGSQIDASCRNTVNITGVAAPSPAAAPVAPAPAPAPASTGGGAPAPASTGGGAPAPASTGGGAPAPASTGGGATPAASELLFKDPTGYLDSKNKQMGAIAAFLICCCLIILLLMGGGGGDNSSAQMQQMLQMKLMGI